jgi:hypothetical protein
MSVMGELKRYLDRSIELLRDGALGSLADLLESAQPRSSDDLPASAERILAALTLHEDDLGGLAGPTGLARETAESVDRLESICRIILGRGSTD